VFNYLHEESPNISLALASALNPAVVLSSMPADIGLQSTRFGPVRVFRPPAPPAPPARTRYPPAALLFALLPVT